MKKLYNKLLVLSTVLLVCNWLSAQSRPNQKNNITNDDEFAISSIEDLSIERRLITHDDEINSLGNYFGVVQNDISVINDYNNLMSSYESKILAEYDYIIENNISYEDIRRDPTIIPINFTITDVDKNKLKTIIQKAKPTATPALAESMTIFDEYVETAHIVQYTPIEIFSDATGLDNPNEYTLNDQQDIQRTSISGDIIEGLQSKEALRKLKELVKNSTKKEPLIISPNPVTPESRINFYNPVKGKSTISIYDISGKVIAHRSIDVSKGDSNLNLSEVFNLPLTNGLYILTVERSVGQKITQKLIINN